MKTIFAYNFICLKTRILSSITFEMVQTVTLPSNESIHTMNVLNLSLG